MKVAIAGVGTRGDIQPLLLLGRALRERGHDAFVCSTPDFADLAAEIGVPFQAVGRPFKDIQREIQAAFEKHPIKAFFGSILDDLTREQARTLPPLVAGADVIVGNAILLLGPAIAEKAGVPFFLSILQPGVLPADDHPPPITPKQDWPRWFNRLLWGLTRGVYNAAALKMLNRARAGLGLGPVRDVSDYIYGAPLLLLAFDPVLTGPLPAWPYPHVVTGLWQPGDTAAPLPADLAAFLAAGPPPVHVAFGSMTASEPEKRTSVIVDAVRQAGVRAVLSTDWAGLGGAVPVPDGCIAIGPVSHAALFPRCAAVVHHGGSGTTASAALAGRPQVVVPHMADQPYWGQRVFRLGLGPRPVPIRQMTAENLGTAIRAAATDPAYAGRAAAISEQLKGRDGLAEAVRAIEARILN